MQRVSKDDFSLKTETFLPVILIAPNLAGGLTAVKVAIALQEL